MLHCKQCKKKFSRLRQYNTHVCTASKTSDYLHLDEKEVRIDLDLFTDDEEEDEEAQKADPTVEFK